MIDDDPGYVGSCGQVWNQPRERRTCMDFWPDFRSVPYCIQPYGHLGDHDRDPWDEPAHHDSGLT